LRRKKCHNQNWRHRKSGIAQIARYVSHDLPSHRQNERVSPLSLLTLAAITVVPEFLTTQLGLPMLIDGRLMTAIVAVALAMQNLPPSALLKSPQHLL
jgi:hypothetical protein